MEYNCVPVENNSRHSDNSTKLKVNKEANKTRGYSEKEYNQGLNYEKKTSVARGNEKLVSNKGTR